MPKTISEQLFEALCSARSVPCRRIPEGVVKTADYEILLDPTNVITEVKQLDQNQADKEMEAALGRGAGPGAIAPSDRVQQQISDAYPQLKRSSEGKLPTMVVLYNNAGLHNWIDSWTVSKAMFGSFGFTLAKTPDDRIVVTKQGYMGERKVTQDTCRALSVVAVINNPSSGEITLDAYHNPFATIPINPKLLSRLASKQYQHPSPHSGNMVSWEPLKLET